LPKARERTIELNPEDIKPENMPVLENFTRLSIGVQSFSDNVLSVLKRSKVGFSTLLDLKTQWQISVDLLIGVPRQTREDVKRDILSAVALGIPHISVYPLEIHEGTPFWSVYKDWDWDDADLMLEIEQFLTERGYEHYEISNYARPGYQCLHNKIYWHDEDYYALGPSAAGYVGGVRYKWISNIKHYIESIEQNKEPPYEEYEEMSLEDQLSEYAIMNLRLLQEGIRRQDVENRFGPSAWDTLVKQANGNTFLSVSDSSIKVSNWLFFNRAAESFV
jgi:oxygen-independent coproporphyrinogen-3 oxidase